MLTTTTILDSRDSQPALPRAGCDTRDQAKGVITLRQHILRLTRGAVFLGTVVLLGAVPAFAQLAGHVAGTDGSPLENIKIELWDSYPDGNLLDSTVSDVLGEFALPDPSISDFDLRARATGYYPTVVRGLPNSTENTRVNMVATPPSPSPTGPAFPNDFWGQESKFLGHLVKPGDVVEATDAANVLLAINPAPIEGGYLLHAIADDFSSPEDDGGSAGETVDFTINGLDANPSGSFASGASTNLEIESILSFPGATVTAPQNIGGVAGDAVLIQFRLENTGNVTESYDVSVDVDSNWTFSVPKSLVGPLTPGEVAIVDVFVDIPLGATGGFATAVVHATAQTYLSANSGSKTQIDVNPTGIFDNNGNGTLVPGSFTLAQNYPNPFNPETQIAFNLGQPGNVRLEVYNIIGQSVAVLVDGYREAGISIIEWDARTTNGENVPSGVYFYRLTQQNESLTRKMVLMR